MTYDFISFLVLTVIAVAAVSAYGRRYDQTVMRLLMLALVVRLVGATARYELVFRYYGGLGDSVRYYRDGMDLARRLWAFTLSPLSPDYWVMESVRWGTRFAIQVSGLVLAVTGPSLRAEFVVFSMFAYAGTLAILFAFNRFHQPRETLRFAWLVVLWPSVWFWPSSVGKEAIIVLAIGLATLGYVGDGKYTRWTLLVAGVALAFMIRPHVAFVLVFAAVAGQWLAPGRGWTPRRVLEAVVGITVAVLVFRGMQGTFGLMDADLEGYAEFVQWHMEQTLQGGSNIGPVALSPLNIPQVLVNVWMRPFPWEAHNLTSLGSAIEMAILWILAWRYRAGIVVLVRNWRQHRLVRFSVLLLLAYTLMIGFSFANLGLIARQRAPVFPFMLMLLIALPSLIVERRRHSSAAKVAIPAIATGATGEPAAG